jgi:large subunit ribosomal protein L25
MDTTPLEAQSRDHVGTRTSRRLRRDGMLPAVIYGHKEGTVSVALEAKPFTDALRKGAHLFDLSVAGAKETVLVKEVQYDYLGDTVIHVDFARVSLDEAITTNVPLNLVNADDAAGVKAGGVLSVKLNTLEVQCKANNIPDEIEADLADLKMGDSLFVHQITLPEGVTTEFDGDTVIARIAQPRGVETPEDEEAAIADSGNEPEVIGEKKEDAESTE